MAKTRGFETSAAFRRRFNSEFGTWKEARNGTLKELAELCGVSASYMSHVSRYGRIPSKSVLILLALNFGIKDADEWFKSAGVDETWPYSRATVLTNEPQDQSSFVSVKVDLPGLTEAIKEIVRAEVKPRKVADLLEKRKIQFGLNVAQWLFFEKSIHDIQFFPDLLDRIATSFHMDYESAPLVFSDCYEALNSGKLDFYGPLYNTPPRVGSSLFSDAFCRVQVSGIMRTAESKSLYALDAPKNMNELLDKPYVIGVLKGTAAEHFAESHIAGGESTLLACDSPGELVERLLLSEIPFPIHCMICDAFITEQLVHEHQALKPIFHDPQNPIGFLENCIAIRPDWPEVLEPINSLLDYLRRQNILQELASRTVPEEHRIFLRF